MTIQLADQAAEPLPDLDEYAGMSATDIAHAVIHWPEGSEDQIRAITALQRLVPHRHYNMPPLDELIHEELAPFVERAERALAVAATSRIIDDVSAAKVTDLIKQLHDIETDVDAARDKRKRPYLEAGRLIDRQYGGLKRRVDIARQGEDGRGGLRAMITRYDDQRQAKIEAERQRQREEQRRREAQAEAARRRAEEAQAAGENSVAAQLEALKAQEEADLAARRAEAIRAEPIRAQLGQVARRREVTFAIDDLRKVLGWILKQTGGAAAAEQFARTWLGKHLRAVGVEAVDRGDAQIPGVTLTVQQGQANVRR